MKRLLIIVFLFSFLLPGCFELIAQDSVQGGMVIQTTTVHKKKKEKKPKKEIEPVKPGFQHSVTLMGGTDFDYFHGEIDYIYGYRFNNRFFAGAGIGLNYDDDGNWDYYDVRTTDFDDYELRNEYSIPLYAHARAYLGKKRCLPFFAFSAGAKFGLPAMTIMLNDSDDYTLYSETIEFVTYLFEPAFGLDVRLTSRASINLQLGATIYGVPRLRFSDSTHAQIYQKTTCDFAIKLGCTF
jgi:hypothetical protein